MIRNFLVDFQPLNFSQCSNVVHSMLWRYDIETGDGETNRITRSPVYSKCVNYNFSMGYSSIFFEHSRWRVSGNPPKPRTYGYEAERIGGKKSTHRNSWTWENWRWNLIMCKFPIASQRALVCSSNRWACFYIYYTHIFVCSLCMDMDSRWMWFGERAHSENNPPIFVCAFCGCANNVRVIYLLFSIGERCIGSSYRVKARS